MYWISLLGYSAGTPSGLRPDAATAAAGTPKTMHTNATSNTIGFMRPRNMFSPPLSRVFVISIEHYIKNDTAGAFAFSGGDARMEEIAVAAVRIVPLTSRDARINAPV